MTNERVRLPTERATQPDDDQASEFVGGTTDVEGSGLADPTAARPARYWIANEVPAAIRVAPRQATTPSGPSPRDRRTPRPSVEALPRSYARDAQTPPVAVDRPVPPSNRADSGCLIRSHLPPCTRREPKSIGRRPVEPLEDGRLDASTVDIARMEGGARSHRVGRGRVRRPDACPLQRLIVRLGEPSSGDGRVATSSMPGAQVFGVSHVQERSPEMINVRDKDSAGVFYRP